MAQQLTAEELRAGLEALVAPAGRRWAVLMCSGGHFAGAVFDGEQAVVSKTFHRYTTRRKQGGAQSANDQAKGKARSGGAMIRRYNERALQQVRAAAAAAAGRSAG